MAEVKYVHQNVGFEVIDPHKGEFRITNRFYFTNLSRYRLVYYVKENEKVLRKGTLSVELEPQGTTVVRVPLHGLWAKVGCEFFVNFEIYTREPEPLIPAGHLLAYDQFRLPIEPLKKEYQPSEPALATEETDGAIRIYSPKVTFVFDKKEAVVTSYQVDGTEYFKDVFGVRPNFWRTPNDNDYGNWTPKRLQIWKESGRDLKVASTTVKEEKDWTDLEVNYLLAAGNNYIVRYRIFTSGIVNVHICFTPTDRKETEIEMSEAMLSATFSPGGADTRRSDADLEVPRIGVRFRLPAGMNQLQYFGRGPEENYIDRKAGILVGLYESTAEEQYYNYVRPQENIHHCDTRWLALTESSGKGLLIRADWLIGFNALRNSIEDFDSEEALPHPRQWTNFSPGEIAGRDEEAAKNVLRRQRHVNDIVFRDFVEVYVDMKQQGVAGYDSWGARVQPGFTIAADKEYNWGFTWIPVKNKKEIHSSLLYDYHTFK